MTQVAINAKYILEVQTQLAAWGYTTESQTTFSPSGESTSVWDLPFTNLQLDTLRNEYNAVVIGDKQDNIIIPKKALVALMVLASDSTTAQQRTTAMQIVNNFLQRLQS